MPSQHASDSEDDPDYVPQAEADSESSDEEPETEDVTVQARKPTAEEAAAREVIWADFQSSLTVPPPSTLQERTTKTVKIEKRYLFAGKEVLNIIEVPEDSPDAKKWPLWQTAGEKNPDTPPTSDLTSSSHSQPPELRPPPRKRPGPRRPKTSLTAPSSQKAKKLTTLDKSAMDWSAHLNTQQDPAIKDELEANRRGGGYLEKVEFLKRVDERKEDVIDAHRSSKRRRL